MVNSKTMNEDDMFKFYSKWSSRVRLTTLSLTSRFSAQYDDDLRNLNHRGQRFTAERLARFVPEAERAAIKILDLACGTGLVGKELHKLGFRHIEGVGEFLFASHLFHDRLKTCARRC